MSYEKDVYLRVLSLIFDVFFLPEPSSSSLLVSPDFPLFSSISYFNGSLCLNFTSLSLFWLDSYSSFVVSLFLGRFVGLD
jgi:hypothetical protein